MENAGKPSGGRLEWSPFSSSLFLYVPVLFAFVFFLLHFLSPSPLSHCFQGILLVGAFAWMLVAFNLDDLQH